MTSELDKAALTQCQQVLESLVTSLLITKPDDPVPHIIQYLQDKKGTGAPPLTKEEKFELNQLREELKKLKAKKAAMKKKQSLSQTPMAQEALDSDDSDHDQKAGADGGGSSSDSEANEEYLDEVHEPLSPLK